MTDPKPARAAGEQTFEERALQLSTEIAAKHPQQVSRWRLQQYMLYLHEFGYDIVSTERVTHLEEARPPAKAAGDKTFEEWELKYAGPRDKQLEVFHTDRLAAWHARDQAVKRLEERIERVRALAPAWKKLVNDVTLTEWPMKGGMPSWAIGIKQCYKELLAALSEE